MNNENKSQFEHELAAAAEPTGGEVEQVESIHNPAESLRIGLAKLYCNYSQKIANQLMSGSIDVNRAKELTAQVDKLSVSDLGIEISKGLPLEMAKEIIGHNMYFGPDEVRKAGIEIREDVPPVPFNIDELERAKELGQMLIYRTSTTMKELNDTIGLKLEKEGKEKLFFHTNLYENEDFFAIDKIQPGWALVSKEPVPGTPGQDYLRQSWSLVHYLVDEVYKNKILPQAYKDALYELVAEKEKIAPLLNSNIYSDLAQARDMLVNLRINQLFRQTPAEVIYDSLVHFQNTGERMDQFEMVLTNTPSFNDRLVGVSHIRPEGAGVVNIGPDAAHDSLIASFCRRAADLKL